MSLRDKILPRELLTAPVIVAALGYFIDVFDIWVFGANRVPSLRDIGVPEDGIFDAGVMIFNLQMAGLLLGGLVFGVLGDRFGRKRLMFASIITYSLATLANGFVDSVPAYAVCRFVAGFGLAGELGLAVTLIAESLPKEKRGYGAGLVVGFGVLGALTAATLAHYIPWRASYILGGCAGLVLLAFRMKIAESALFERLKPVDTPAHLAMLFTSRERMARFFWCVCLVLPVWYGAGILVTFAPELIKAEYGFTVAAATIMVWHSSFLALNDFGSAWISQWIGSRRKVLLFFMGFGFLATALLLLWPTALPLPAIIALYICNAIGTGCWVLGVTVAAESFGTNLRATVATTVPNFGRAAAIPMTLGLASMKDIIGIGNAAMIIGAVVFTLALIGAWKIPETCDRDMDYLEG